MSDLKIPCSPISGIFYFIKVIAGLSLIYKSSYLASVYGIS